MALASNPAFTQIKLFFEICKYSKPDKLSGVIPNSHCQIILGAKTAIHKPDSPEKNALMGSMRRNDSLKRFSSHYSKRDWREKEKTGQ